ncbi:MAG: hypothetical protein WBM87_03905 [Woeseiaceae bacterium]
MPGNAAGKATPGSEIAEDGRSLALFLRRKVWLPRLLYAALPYFYVLSGLTALLATFYIAEWFWVLPHYVLFSIFCIHIGILVYRRRHRKTAAMPVDHESAIPPNTP